MLFVVVDMPIPVPATKLIVEVFTPAIVCTAIWQVIVPVAESELASWPVEQFWTLPPLIFNVTVVVVFVELVACVIEIPLPATDV
jgi:hypothetical protein